MRILISLVSFLLTLVGFNPQAGTTTLTFSSVDGVGVNSSKARIADGNARFECLQSASGSCHYVVFTSACAQVDKRANYVDACSTRVVETFTLAAGDVRELTGLPVGVKHCLDHDTMPVAPDCAKG
ncbi:MAG TPA: hypothetical protein VIT22_01625 [Pseudoxanthomonas sp.]